MGTTLDQLQAGGGTVQWVAAIGGYPHLLTDGSTSAAVTAWAGTDWTQAIGGLVVMGKWQQEIHPYEPFRPGGSTLSLFIPDSPDSTFGQEVFRSPVQDTAQTYLTATADNSALTLTVKRTADFPASGELSLGTERIGYTGKTATTFTGCTRGLYAPFKHDAVTQRFGGYHRVGQYDYSSPALEPVVTASQRSWKGRWVGLWLHRRTGSTLDTRSEAQCCFAGRIVEVRDDPNALGTVVVVESVMESIAEATLLRDQWTGRVRSGVHLEAGQQFTAKDVRESTANTADPLVVVSGSSIGPNEISAGYHELSEFVSKLNSWLAAENLAGNLLGSYSFTSPQDTGEGLRTVLNWSMPSTGSGQLAAFAIGGPPHAWTFLGYFPATSAGNGYIEDQDVAGDAYQLVSEEEPYVTMFTALYTSGHPVGIESSRGVFADQAAFLPPQLNAALLAGSGDWGIFESGGAVFIAQYVSATELDNLFRAPSLEGASAPGFPPSRIYGRRASEDPVVELRQIMILQGRIDELIPALFLSTGTLGYNSATHDVLGYGLGLGLPWELLGDNFVSDCDMLATASATITMILDKPTKFVDAIGADLVLRRSHLVWKNGGIRLTSWSTPTLAASEHALGEDNKAAPLGTSENPRSPSVITDEWHRDLIKIQYNRSLSTGEYGSVVVLEDRTSIDDNGGHARPVTISARNAYGNGGGSSAPQIDILIPDFLAWMPFFSRPYRKIKRSIDLRLFEGVAPGDVVTLTDDYARNPATGLRGLDNVVGLIVSHTFDFGGPEPGDPTSIRPMVGEVDVIILDTDRVFAYAPAAHVDETVTGGGFSGGYNAGTKTLRCRAHEYSYATDVADAGRFQATDKVRVYQIDAVGGLSWSDTVASASGNDIVLTTGLAGYDSTKLYRVTYDDYGTATTGQRAYAFEADDADGRIVDLAGPNLYGGSQAPVLYTIGAHTAIPERPEAASVAGDGRAHDSGADMAMAVAANNLIDHKTAQNAPVLGLALSGKAGPTLTLVNLTPLFIGENVFTSASNRRKLTVAPFMRSTDGLTATVRVTISFKPPVDTAGADQFGDVTFAQPYAQATFTSSSTTWATATAQDLDAGVARNDDPVWLSVECSDNAECRGVAQARLSERKA